MTSEAIGLQDGDIVIAMALPIAKPTAEMAQMGICSPSEKRFLKNLKRYRETCKIEDAITAGVHPDPQQVAKLRRKPTVVLDLRDAITALPEDDPRVDAMLLQTRNRQWLARLDLEDPALNWVAAPQHPANASWVPAPQHPAPRPEPLDSAKRQREL